MKKLMNGFTLIELMIVVAIIGILSAIAVTSYNDYHARAQVTEAMSLATGLKSGLTQHFVDNGLWPSTITMASGKYVSTIEITGGGNAGTVVLKVIMKASGINANIASRQFLMSSIDGGNSWQCGTLAQDFDPALGIPAKYLPGACK